ncbi:MULTISPECIES: hypothetical protein [unclassified Synechococcus]|uniref:hypothetical protein n=1 Tax=unclassified Synechococcus TaxID=2626047 RepID=UPI001C23BF81|nr:MULTISPECIES: hypothetical protein [unclassified Synechococcus]
MNTTDTDRALLLALVALAVAIEALAVLMRPLVAHGLALLLTLAGWRPSSSWPASGELQERMEAAATPSVLPATAPAPEAAGGQLVALPVRELRQLARAAGHRSLARSGRRQQLLEALT